MTDEKPEAKTETSAPAEPDKTSAPAEPKTKRLRVSGPFNCTAMNFPDREGGTLTVTREGTDVPAKDAKALIKTAAENGVTLTEVSE